MVTSLENWPWQKNALMTKRKETSSPEAPAFLLALPLVLSMVSKQWQSNEKNKNSVFMKNRREKANKLLSCVVITVCENSGWFSNLNYVWCVFIAFCRTY